MKSNQTTERTLVIIKPDGVQRSLIGEVISRFEKVGLKIIAIKFVLPTPQTVEEHYLVDPDWREKTGNKNIETMKEKGVVVEESPTEIGQRVLDSLKKYFVTGPVAAIVLEGPNSVKLVRKLVGTTEPLSSDVGTIRGDYVLDSYAFADAEKRSVRNLIHASSSVDDANAEIKIWFQEKELLDYITAQERMLHSLSANQL